MTVNFQAYTRGIDRSFRAAISLRIKPSGLSSKNSKAAVSFSINEILIYRSRAVRRQSRINNSLLSAANNDLASLSFAIGESTKVFVRLEVYDGKQI